MYPFNLLSLDLYLNESQLLLLIILSVPILYYLYLTPSSPPSTAPPTNRDSASDNKKEDEQPQTVMQPENADLAPPRDDPFTLEQLSEFDGSDESKPIYVAIKRDVFDVTRKAEVYGAGKSYNIFAGKDGSRGLGKSSLKTEDAVWDYSTLDPSERKVLDDWHSFFQKRYNVVGRVVGLPGLSEPEPSQSKI